MPIAVEDSDADGGMAALPGGLDALKAGTRLDPGLHALHLKPLRGGLHAVQVGRLVGQAGVAAAGAPGDQHQPDHDEDQAEHREHDRALHVTAEQLPVGPGGLGAPRDGVVGVGEHRVEDRPPTGRRRPPAPCAAAPAP